MVRLIPLNQRYKLSLHKYNVITSWSYRSGAFEVSPSTTARHYIERNNNTFTRKKLIYSVTILRSTCRSTVMWAPAARYYVYEVSITTITSFAIYWQHASPSFARLMYGAERARNKNDEHVLAYCSNNWKIKNSQAVPKMCRKKPKKKFKSNTVKRSKYIMCTLCARYCLN